MWCVGGIAMSKQNEGVEWEVFEHEGVIGSTFYHPLGCDSCGKYNEELFDVIAGSDLGDLLNLDEEYFEIETPGGVEPGGEVANICDECLDHLLEAKKMQNA